MLGRRRRWNPDGLADVGRVLAALEMFGPGYPLDISARVGIRFWQTSVALVHCKLLGWVTSTAVQTSPDAPARSLYTITDTGRDALPALRLKLAQNPLPRRWRWRTPV